MDTTLKKNLEKMGNNPDTATGLDMLTLSWIPEHNYPANLYIEALKQIKKLQDLGNKLVQCIDEGASIADEQVENLIEEWKENN